MNENLSCLIKDADIHIFGMQVDSTVILMLTGVKSHLVLLWLNGGVEEDDILSKKRQE